MSVRIIVTGGTFDKIYDEIAGNLILKESQLPKILDQVRVSIPIIFEINQLIDSLHMTGEDRKRILSACQKSPESQIIITHGTDTMVETAHVLSQAEIDKTIVLTGAMVPFSVYGSDALFNLGSAVGVVQVLDPGIYITMNGRIFNWDNVHKDRQRGIFQTLH